jgi:hypothetical protein
MSKKDPPMTEEATPPRLSEKLISQLQGAVSAAQRKRMPHPNRASASRSAATATSPPSPGPVHPERPCKLPRQQRKLEENN